MFALVSVRVGKLEMVTYVSETGKGEASPKATKPHELKKLETYPLIKIRSWKVGDKVSIWRYNSMENWVFGINSMENWVFGINSMENWVFGINSMENWVFGINSMENCGIRD